MIHYVQVLCCLYDQGINIIYYHSAGVYICTSLICLKTVLVQIIISCRSEMPVG